MQPTLSNYISMAYQNNKLHQIDIYSATWMYVCMYVHIYVCIHDKKDQNKPTTTRFELVRPKPSDDLGDEPDANPFRVWPINHSGTLPYADVNGNEAFCFVKGRLATFSDTKSMLK